MFVGLVHFYHIIFAQNGYLVGGLEHFLCFHILGIIILADIHIFQRGRYTTNQLSHHFFVSEVVIPFSHHVYAMFYRQSGLGARKSLPVHLCDDFCQSGQLCFNMFQHLAISKFVMFQHMKYYNMINSAIHITFDDI